MDKTSMEALADKFFRAVELSDLLTIGAIYTHDAVVWHSCDAIAQSRADNIAVLATFPNSFDTFKYCDVRRHFFDGGLVQQHVLRGTTKAGAPFGLYACMIILVRGQQIWRIEEYFDSAQVPPLVPLEG